MNPIELEAYRMLLLMGSIEQAVEAVNAIVKLEPSVPDELIDVVIQTMQERGYRALASKQFVSSVHALIEKTKSKPLYQAANQMDYLTDGCLCQAGSMYTCERVAIYVNMLYYDEQLENLVLKELLKWMTHLDALTKARYSGQPISNCALDDKIRTSHYVDRPQRVIHPILSAIEKIGSDAARLSVRAMEYIFRPHLNEYTLLRQTLAKERNPLAEPFDDDGNVIAGEWEQTHIMRVILDRMPSIAQTAGRACIQPAASTTPQIRE